MIVKKDCKYYVAYKPCKFHKADKRLCDNCKDYLPVKTRILIVKLDALGDVLRTTSILPALVEKYPNTEITWLTRKNAKTLLKDNSFIDRILVLEENFVQFLLTEHFDIAICLDADPQSASVLSLAEATEKVGFTTELNSKVTPVNNEAFEWWHMGINDDLKKENRKTYQEHIYKICKLDTKIKKPQIQLDNQSLKFAENFKSKNNLGNYSKIIGINTGGGGRWELKKWIHSYYIEFIKLIKQKNPQTGILLYGGPEEIELNQNIKMELGDLIIDTGCSNSIQDFSALINLCNIFFTSDSLGMHISVALDKTTIVLVGPTSPWELEVFGNGEIIYNNKLECISCYKSTCDFVINCMNSLKPEFIYSKISKYL
jgi:ADP-heptose:LPS heptosyltransferase